MRHEVNSIRISVETSGGICFLTVREGSTAFDLLQEMRLYPDAHLILKKGAPIPITETLVSGDDVKIVRIASGG